MTKVKHFFLSYQFDDEEVTIGSKSLRCSITIVLKDEEFDDIKIKCSSKPKKKMIIKDLVLSSKAMKKFTLSFSIHKSKTKILSSVVETG